MNKAIPIVIFILFLVIPALKPAVADDRLENLKGMSEEDVLKLMGQPDKKELKGNGTPTWVFGNSLIFFRNETVVAWSDSGDLKPRINLSLIRDTRNSDFLLFSRGWENAWTPKKRISKRQVLDALIRQSTSSSDSTNESPDKSGKDSSS